jgi:hypothetical protein
MERALRWVHLRGHAPERVGAHPSLRGDDKKERETIRTRGSTRHGGEGDDKDEREHGDFRTFWASGGVIRPHTHTHLGGKLGRSETIEARHHLLITSSKA